MTEGDGEKQHREPVYDEFAKYLVCAWIAYRWGVTLPTAKRNVEKALQERGKQHPGVMWYHVAEYIEKLQAGYLPFDLNQMIQDDSEEPEEPEQWIQ